MEDIQVKNLFSIFNVLNYNNVLCFLWPINVFVCFRRLPPPPPLLLQPTIKRARYEGCVEGKRPPSASEMNIVLLQWKTAKVGCSISLFEPLFY